MNKIKIEYISFLNESGYGMAAQDLILSLHNSNNYDIKLNIFGSKPSRPSVSDERYGAFMKMLHKERDKEAIMIYHCIPPLQKKFKKNKRSLGFATFETFEPPDQWLQILNRNDALVVPSQFNYKVFAYCDVKKPIYRIPHCFDDTLYNLSIRPLKKFDKFTFLFMGTWKMRKGYKQLIESWLREFKDSDSVQLVIKTDKINKAKEYIEKIKKQLGITKGFAPILFESQVFDEKTLPCFMKSFDCFVLPTLGEGFNIPGLQCMALGVPVLITDYSGCKDYANERTSTLIKTDGFIMHKDMDGIPQFRNKKWAFVTVDKIRKGLRFIVNNPMIINKKMQFANDYVMNNFRYEKVEELFQEMLRSLYNV
jgi:glycosyltransferase involved in cell wall biosynthesis